MARLQVIDPANATGRVKEIFDGPLKGKHINIFKGMANSPAVLEVYLGMAGALHKASLSGKEQEAIQLAIGHANGCDYCEAAHTVMGKGAGLSEAQTIEARKGNVASDAKIGGLVKFALALHEKRGHVSDDDLAAVRRAGYTDAQIAETTAVYGLAAFTNYFNHVNQTAIDFPAPPAV